MHRGGQRPLEILGKKKKKSSVRERHATSFSAIVCVLIYKRYKRHKDL